MKESKCEKCIGITHGTFGTTEMRKFRIVVSADAVWQVSSKESASFPESDPICPGGTLTQSVSDEPLDAAYSKTGTVKEKC